MQGFLKKQLRLLFFILLGLSANTYADRWCFAFAKTYFEQVYCEVKAKGKGQNLPSIYEFRNNPENVQALLLKRPAASINIHYAIPTKTPRVKQETPIESTDLSSTVLDNCSIKDKTWICGSTQYQLVGNKANHKLNQHALSQANKMGLQDYSGSLTDSAAIDAYLYQSYVNYIEKMLTIGLGAVTMSYGQFAFLFKDLQDKQVSFSQRFETMYNFLKKDKALIAVDESTALNHQLTVNDCDDLNRQLIVCYKGGFNYIFSAESP